MPSPRLPIPTRLYALFIALSWFLLSVYSSTIVPRLPPFLRRRLPCPDLAAPDPPLDAGDNMQRLRRKRHVVLSLTISLPPALNGFKPPRKLTKSLPLVPVPPHLRSRSQLSLYSSSPPSTPSIETPSTPRSILHPLPFTPTTDTIEHPLNPIYFRRPSPSRRISLSAHCSSRRLFSHIRPASTKSKSKSSPTSTSPPPITRTSLLTSSKPKLRHASSRSSLASLPNATGQHHRASRWKRLNHNLTAAVEASLPVYWPRSREYKQLHSNRQVLDRHALSLSFAVEMERQLQR